MKKQLNTNILSDESGNFSLMFDQQLIYLE